MTLPAALSLNNKTGGVTRIAHREYLDYVNGVQVTAAYPLQPASFSTFTWLPNVALRFESYRVVRFDVHYIPSASAMTNGAIHFAIDYDCLDETPSSPARLSQFTTYARTQASQPVVLSASIPNSNRVPWHYTGSDEMPVTGKDLKLYNFGNLYVYANGDDVVAGEIFLDYVFEFSGPTIEEPEATTVHLTYIPGDAPGGVTRGVVQSATGSATVQSLVGNVLSDLGNITSTKAGKPNLTGNAFEFLRDFSGFINQIRQAPGRYYDVSTGKKPGLSDSHLVTGPWYRLGHQGQTSAYFDSMGDPGATLTSQAFEDYEVTLDDIVDIYLASSRFEIQAVKGDWIQFWCDYEPLAEGEVFAPEYASSFCWTYIDLIGGPLTVGSLWPNLRPLGRALSGGALSANSSNTGTGLPAAGEITSGSTPNKGRSTAMTTFGSLGGDSPDKPSHSSNPIAQGCPTCGNSLAH
jgi:hypothetical protein